MMELYLLEVKHPYSDKDNPFEKHYDLTHGLVVRAATEQEARQEAAEYTKGEHWNKNYKDINPEDNPWLNEQFTSCKVISKEGVRCVILDDFRAG